MLYVALPTSASFENGKVLAIHASSGSQADPRHVGIELEAGHRVKARLPNQMPYRPGATAQISISRAKLRRAVRYRVTRCLE
jgi:hypothetical protein